MIYGPRQFELAQWQTVKPISATVKCLNRVHPEGKRYIVNDAEISVIESQKAYEIDISQYKDDKQFEMYIQYLCSCYKVKDIFWRILPCGMATSADLTWAIGAFIIDGQFDYSQYKEIK